MKKMQHEMYMTNTVDFIVQVYKDKDKYIKYVQDEQDYYYFTYKREEKKD